MSIAPRSRIRRVLLVTAAVAALAAGATLPGCGCRGAAPLAFVPQDALVALVVPSISAGMKEAKLLLDKFRDETPVKMVVDRIKEQLTRELGVDPEKPETLKAKGINPDVGLVASLASDGKSTAIALGVSDWTTLDKTLREVVSKAMGGGVQFMEKVVDGLKVTLVTTPGVETPQLAWAESKKFLLLCPAAKDGKLGEYLAKVSKLDSNLKSNKTYTNLVSKLGKHQVAVYIDGETARKAQAAKIEEELKTASDWSRKYIKDRQEAAEGFFAYFRGAAISLRISAEGLKLRGFMGITPEKAKSVQEIFKGTGDAAHFGKYIGADALALGRVSLNTKKLMDRLVEAMPPGAKRSFYSAIEQLEREAKLSIEKDVLGLIAGRYAAALFAPSLEVIKAGPPRGSAGWARALPAVLMAQVSDATKVSELLAKLERVLVMGHVEVRTRADGDRRVYSIEDDGHPVVSWTVVKDVAVVATGDRLPKTVALINGKGDNVLGQIDNSRAKSLLKSDEGNLLYFNISKTAELVRSMDFPAEVKAILSTPLSTVSKLADATIDFEVEEAGIIGEYVLRVK
jgi:hypothetical protein